MQTMAAVVERPGGPFAIVEVDIEPPRSDEVLVRIVATGLCHTDLTVAGLLPTQAFPYVFGHEGAGIVEAVGGQVQGVEVGDHVVLSYRSCRRCSKCRSGQPAYCELHLLLNYMGSRPDGSRTLRRGDVEIAGSFFGQSSFAQHVLASRDNLVVVDPKLDLAELAPFGCGYQTGGGAILNVLQPGEDDSVAVYGVGAVGLAAVAAAKGVGVEKIVAIDLSEDRLAHARRLGATTIHSREVGPGDLGTAVRDLTGGGVDCAVETTAVGQVVRQAVDSLSSGGRLVLLGLGEPHLNLNAIDLLQGGKSIRGSIEGDSDPQQMIPALLAAAGEGRFEVSGLAERYDFKDLNLAAEDARSGRVVKPVLVW